MGTGALVCGQGESVALLRPPGRWEALLGASAMPPWLLAFEGPEAPPPKIPVQSGVSTQFQAFRNLSGSPGPGPRCSG